MIFKDPIYFIFLPIAIFVILFIIKRRDSANNNGIFFPTNIILNKLKNSLKIQLFRRIFILRIVTVTLIIFALARPQAPLQETKILSEGIDIALVLDCSTSMLAEDFKLEGRRQNRVEVIKNVVKDFINERPTDKISLVAFASVAYTVCPATLDHNWLLENLKRVKAGMLADGTAVGTGITVALNRFKNSTAKSKIIILLTDGRNNAGKISPTTAAEAAKALGVKIYTIGAGGKGPVPYPFQDVFGNIVYRSVEVDLDEDALMKIAQTTEAKYFRATDTESLKKIYQEINQLEKVSFEEKGFREYKELFPYFLILTMILLLVEIILKNTWLITIP